MSKMSVEGALGGFAAAAIGAGAVIAVGSQSFAPLAWTGAAVVCVLAWAAGGWELLFGWMRPAKGAATAAAGGGAPGKYKSGGHAHVGKRR